MKKNLLSKSVKSWQYLALILLLAVLLRIPLLDNTIAFDEYVQTHAVIDANPAGLDKGTEIPPLTTWTRLLFASLFGSTPMVLKAVSLLFGLLTIALVYLLAKELFSERVALWSSLIMALSAWHVLGSTSISFDGAFLTFYYTLTIFCFVKYIGSNNQTTKAKRSKNMFWLFLTGIAFGFAMLTKLNAILLVPILVIYGFMTRYSFTKKGILLFIKEFFIIGIIAVLLFAVFPLAAWLGGDWSYFTIVFTHTGVFKNAAFSLALLSIQYAQSFIWIGPLLIGLYVLSLFRLKYLNKNHRSQEWLLHVWIWIVLAFFTFGVQENFRPVERYFFVLLPALCILGSLLIDEFLGLKRTPSKRVFFISGGALIVSLMIIAGLNLAQNTVLPFYPKTQFISATLHGQWLFYMPFTGDQGPVGLYISFASIMFAFIASLVAILAMLCVKSKGRKLLLFVIFIGVAFAFNLFMIEEQSYALATPNIDRASQDAIEYALTHELKQPILIFRNYALKYYLEQNYSDFKVLDFKDESLFSVEEYLPNGGTVLVVDFPKMNEQSALWMRSHQCAAVYQDANRLAYIVECP